MGWIVFRGISAGLIVIGVSLLSERHPRVGALLLSLPVVSMLAFVAAWLGQRDVSAISTFARETLVLVPLGLTFFLPLAFARQLQLSFWPAFALGAFLAAATIGAWFIFAPRSL